MTDNTEKYKLVELNLHNYITNLVNSDSNTINVNQLSILYSVEPEKLKTLISNELKCVKSAYENEFKELLNRLQSITDNFENKE